MRLECHPDTHVSTALYLDNPAQAGQILYGSSRMATSRDEERHRLTMSVARKMRTVVDRGEVADLVLSGPEINFALGCLAHVVALHAESVHDPHRVAALEALHSVTVEYPQAVIEEVAPAPPPVITELAA